MNRPTIALCCIMRDEIHHIKPMLESVAGCFDEIWLTDTGSVDGTLEWAKSDEASRITGCPVHVKQFVWVNDFAAARNYSMEGVKTDFVMWMDLDDALSDKEAFKKWRDNVMILSDYWMVPYNYAFDANRRPACTFLRERVIKTAKKFTWQYFIHEGMIAGEPVQANCVTNWAVDHRRNDEDYKKDYERNVSMLEDRAKKEELPPRLQWYYGKELHDKGRFAEAYTWLDRVVDNPKLELHDRTLCYEYLVRSCLQRFFKEELHKQPHERDLRLVVKAQQLALMGLALAPMRAEFFCLVGDCLVQQGKEVEALPMYTAAAACVKPKGQTGFLFINHAAYDYVPLNAISMIKYKMGDLDGAIWQASEAFKKFQDPSTSELLQQFLNLKQRLDKHGATKKVLTDEVVFTCVPNSHPYAFDEEVYETKGIGGSETALVEVARLIREQTGRPVTVFNTRESEKVCSSGVVYKPAHTMYDYFTEHEPALHIAWRHNMKVTDAKTFLWCHDLYTPGAEVKDVYDKHICLSEFHKNYVQVLQQIPDHKIHISRNGVNRARFLTDIRKNENKIIWPNSPDRGLERAIDIVERARKVKPDLELHVFYGLDNLYKYGQKEKADKLKALIDERPWVKYVGNVDQARLAREMQESVVWLYPANFIETFCITAVEALYARCFGLVREIGALKDTVRPFHEKGYARLLFSDAETDKERQFWTDQLLEVLESRAWEKIKPHEFNYDWAGVAEDFLKLAGLDAQKETELRV